MVLNICTIHILCSHHRSSSATFTETCVNSLLAQCFVGWCQALKDRKKSHNSPLLPSRKHPHTQVHVNIAVHGYGPDDITQRNSSKPRQHCQARPTSYMHVLVYEVIIRLANVPAEAGISGPSLWRIGVDPSLLGPERSARHCSRIFCHSGAPVSQR